MRQCEFILTEQHPSFIQYDGEMDKLYIVDFTSMSFTNPDNPQSCVIDRDSPFVTAFNIRRRDTPGITDQDHVDQPQEPSGPPSGTNSRQGGSAPWQVTGQEQGGGAPLQQGATTQMVPCHQQGQSGCCCI